MSGPLRVISFGAGVQTTALAILNASGRVGNPARDLVFADTGAEKPETLSYLREHFEPWAARNGLTLHVTRSAKETLEGEALRRRIVPSLNTRWCTDMHKVRVINRWLVAHGATATQPADVQIGISADESHRARDGWARRYSRKRWPLCDLLLTRTHCRDIIVAAGLPVPVKSGCYFCPLQPRASWQRLSVEHPALIDRALALEINACRRKERETLAPGFVSLRSLLGDATQTSFDDLLEADEQCVSGACFL